MDNKLQSVSLIKGDISRLDHKKPQLVLEWEEFIKNEKKLPIIDLPSYRMVSLANWLPKDDYIAWRVVAKKDSLVKYYSFSNADLSIEDLEWISEGYSKKKRIQTEGMSFVDQTIENWYLYELYYPISREKIGGKRSPGQTWPSTLALHFDEFVSVIRTHGAIVQFALGKASSYDYSKCRASIIANSFHHSISVEDYIGKSVRVKCYVAVPSKMPIRMSAVLNNITGGAELNFIKRTNSKELEMIFSNPLKDYDVLPNYAAMVLSVDPVVERDAILGLKVKYKSADKYYSSHENSPLEDAIIIGRSVSNLGYDVDVNLGSVDLKRHWHIIGQSGTGKSSLLANSLSDAIKKGYGLTFFDPHGETIDILLRMISEDDAKRVKVIRFGDLENPVPLNLISSNSLEDSEKMIADLISMFVEIHDPHNQSIVGPRWERWFNTYARAAILTFGNKASFDTIITLSQKNNYAKFLSEALKYRDADLSVILKEEYGTSSRSDVGDFINWVVSKLDRITGNKAIKNIVGSGANAIDFKKNIDSNEVILIDLASPKLGTNTSRVLATLIMIQLWHAITEREKRNMTHIVAIDEAHLFQNNPLPQMLSEGRKFGLSLILANQHLGQLAPSIREALDANAGSFTAFRLSVKDSLVAAQKFERNNVQKDLCRLDSFQAITTLSVNGIQSSAFTLYVDKPLENEFGDNISEEIRKKSKKVLVDPYRQNRPLDRKETIDQLQRHSKKPLPPVLRMNTTCLKAAGSIEFPIYLQKIQLLNHQSDFEFLFFQILIEAIMGKLEYHFSCSFIHSFIHVWRKMINDYEQYGEVLEQVFEEVKEEVKICKMWLLSDGFGKDKVLTAPCTNEKQTEDLFSDIGFKKKKKLPKKEKKKRKLISVELIRECGVKIDALSEEELVRDVTKKFEDRIGVAVWNSLSDEQRDVFKKIREDTDEDAEVAYEYACGCVDDIVGLVNSELDKIKVELHEKREHISKVYPVTGMLDIWDDEEK